MKDPNELLRIGEAAQLLKVSEQTLRRWDNSGKLKSYRKHDSSNRLYRRGDLELFLEELYAVGQTWASSEQPSMPLERYYNEQQPRFQSRLGKMAIEMQLQHPKEVGLLSLVAASAGEIGDNAFAHNAGNWIDITGLFYAYHLGKREIILADRGRGVLTTLQKVKPELKTDREALRVAFTEVISGRAPERRGNGLKFVREVMEENAVGLTFQSGSAMATIPKNNGRMVISNAPNVVRGTFAYIYF